MMDGWMDGWIDTLYGWINRQTHYGWIDDR